MGKEQHIIAVINNEALKIIKKWYKEGRGQQDTIDEQIEQCNLEEVSQSNVELSQIYNKSKVLIGTKIGDTFNCAMCDKFYKEKFHLNDHFKKKHELKNADDINSLTCTICKKIFSTQYSLHRHMKDH